MNAISVSGLFFSVYYVVKGNWVVGFLGCGFEFISLMGGLGGVWVLDVLLLLFLLGLFYGIGVKDSSDGKTYVLFFFSKLLRGVLWTWTDTRYIVHQRSRKEKKEILEVCSITIYLLSIIIAVRSCIPVSQLLLPIQRFRLLLNFLPADLNPADKNLA